MLLEHNYAIAIYCWKAQYLISKIIYNTVLDPETIRIMTSLNMVTNTMTIIGKCTMPRMLCYIDCVSTLQLWTQSYSL